MRDYIAAMLFPRPCNRRDRRPLRDLFAAAMPVTDMMAMHEKFHTETINELMRRTEETSHEIDAVMEMTKRHLNEHMSELAKRDTETCECARAETCTRQCVVTSLSNAWECINNCVVSSHCDAATIGSVCSSATGANLDKETDAAELDEDAIELEAYSVESRQIEGSFGTGPTKGNAGCQCEQAEKCMQQCVVASLPNAFVCIDKCINSAHCDAETIGTVCKASGATLDKKDAAKIGRSPTNHEARSTDTASQEDSVTTGPNGKPKCDCGRAARCDMRCLATARAHGQPFPIKCIKKCILFANCDPDTVGSVCAHDGKTLDKKAMIEDVPDNTWDGQHCHKDRYLDCLDWCETNPDGLCSK